MLHPSYRLTCDSCNKREFNSGDESEIEARKNARVRGWSFRRVPNGAGWDICPSCFPRFQECPEFEEQENSGGKLIERKNIPAARIILQDAAGVLKGHAERLLAQAEQGDWKSETAAAMTLDQVKKLAWVYDLLK